MRYVGRIITNSKVDDVSEFIEVTKGTSSIVDNQAKIPTIIVGYKNAESICGKLNVLNKKIGNNLYWTFSKRERRIDYDPDMRAFFSNVSDFVMKYCKYEYIDLITADDEKKNHLKNVLASNVLKVVYSTEQMYYIYVPHENITYGLAKSVVDFVGWGDIDGNNIVSVEDTEFSENKISKAAFANPLLYYLKTF